MTTPPDLVMLTRVGDIAVLTLNRPDAANAIDLPMAAALKRQAQQLAADDWARVIVLRANGRMFCGGGDTSAFRKELQDGGAPGFVGLIADLVNELHEGLSILLSLDAPLIAAVQGTAAGAGMSLALAADFTYAKPTVRFVPAYPGIGFSADGGMSWFLPRIVGARRAAQIMLSNEVMEASTAAAAGIVTEVLADDDFDAAVMRKAEALAAGPRRAMGVIRRLINESLDTPLSAQLKAEAAGMIQLSSSSDVAEGLLALSERRAPRFTQ
jgi:2-(1,2-epoxy-1,2-dihydrophenyl)acetyl-CoA isomerase